MTDKRTQVKVYYFTFIIGCLANNLQFNKEPHVYSMYVG